MRRSRAEWEELIDGRLWDSEVGSDARWDWVGTRAMGVNLEKNSWGYVMIASWAIEYMSAVALRRWYHPENRNVAEKTVDVRFPSQTKSERVFQENKSNRCGYAGPITCWNPKTKANIIESATTWREELTKGQEKTTKKKEPNDNKSKQSKYGIRNLNIIYSVGTVI